jgi:hypothetical protein
MVLMTLDSDEMMLIASTPAWEKRQLELRKQLLLALVRRPDLTAEQTARITQALSFLSDVQLKEK